MATPLIRIPQEQGGTMYAFASAAKDLTRAYYNPDINFEYSKFALLDLPVVSTPAPGSTNNYIEFGNLFEAGPVSGGGVAPNYDATLPDDNANRHFAQTLQNYALNLENFILTDDDYDSTLYKSDAEKIFFKWLHHIGAFRVKSATSQQAATGFSRFVEETDSEQVGSEYSRVVKYVGTIDVSNDKNYGGETYNEIFINIPSAVGYTPEILFRSTPYNTTATSYQPLTNYISGRDGQTHPDSNINLDPIADASDGSYDVDTNSTYNYGIEWNSSAYAKIVNDPKLNNLFDYSKRGGDFRFNAILVYYDLYSKSNIGNKSTNLYGIILLDNWKYDSGSTGWYIPELTKYKPNEVTGLNGNAFALKLNVKFNSSLDNVGVEKNINDYSTFSMDLFFDTTSTLERAAKLLTEANNKYAEIAQRVSDIENLVLTSGQVSSVVERVSLIESSLENAQLNYANSTSILDLITSANDRINQLISGQIPAELQYNTDVIHAGKGTAVERTGNQIKIINTNEGYNLADTFVYDKISQTVEATISATSPFNPTLSSTKGIWTRIKPFENLVRVYIDQNSFGDNLNIYLDDSITQWKKGQVVKFTFKNDLSNMGAYSVSIYTDAVNGWVNKASFTFSSLLTNKPYIELVCVDEINKTFELDIIR